MNFGLVVDKTEIIVGENDKIDSCWILNGIKQALVNKNSSWVKAT